MQALKKNPEADLKLKYQKVLEAAMAIALILMIGVFYSFKKFEASFQLPAQPHITIETVEIPLNPLTFLPDVREPSSLNKCPGKGHIPRVRSSHSVV